MAIHITWKVALFALFLSSVIPLFPLVSADHAVRGHAVILWPNSRPFFEGMTYGSFCSPRNGTADVVRTFDLCRSVGADVRSTFCWTSQSPNWAGAAVNPIPGNRAQPIVNANSRVVRGRAYACSDAINLNNVLVSENADRTVAVSWATGINADSSVELRHMESPFEVSLKAHAETRRHTLTTAADDVLQPGNYDVEVTSASAVTHRSQTVLTTFTYVGNGREYVDVNIIAPPDGAVVEYDPVGFVRVDAVVDGSSPEFTTVFYYDFMLTRTTTCRRGEPCSFLLPIPMPGDARHNLSIIASTGTQRAMDTKFITVDKRTPSVVFSGPVSTIYGEATAIGCRGRDPILGDLPATLTIDGRPAVNPDAENLGAGTYTYACNVAETEQTAATMATRTLTVNRADPTVNLFLNGEARDVTVTSGDSVDILGQLRMLGIDTGVLILSIDEVEIARGLSEASRTYIFNDVSGHRVIASYEGNQNYTPVLAMRLVTVNPAPVLPVLTFAPPTPMDGATIESPLRIAIESTKDLSSATASITDAMGRVTPAAMTRIDARHYEASFILALGVYTYRATATDVEGLTGTTETRSITIATGAPVITFIAPTPANDVSIEGSFTVAILSSQDLSSASLTVVDSMGRDATLPMSRVDARHFQTTATIMPETYTYSVNAINLMGVLGSSETRRITVLVPGPVITFVTPPTPLSGGWAVSPVNVLVESNADLSSADAAVINSMGMETTIPMSRVDARHYQAAIPLEPDTYTFHVSGVDLMGRVGVSEDRRVSISPLVVAHTFSDYAFGGLVNYQRTIGAPPFEPPALFVGTRAAPMTYGGTIQRSYDGTTWETVESINYIYLRGVDRTPIEGIYSMYADPSGWIYATTGGWRDPVNGPAQAAVFYSQNGGTTWSILWQVVPYLNKITAVNVIWGRLQWGSDGIVPPSQSRGFWTLDGGGYLMSNPFDSGVVKIAGLTAGGNDYTFYFTGSGSVYRGIAYPYGSEVNTPVGDFGDRVDDAVAYNNRVYVGGLVGGVPSIYSTIDGVTFTSVRSFGPEVTAIKGFYAASNGKLYFATSAVDRSKVWSINRAGAVTDEFIVPPADEINYISELNNYLYMASVNGGSLELYKWITPLS